jgi:hypothetical protein
MKKTTKEKKVRTQRVGRPLREGGLLAKNDLSVKLTNEPEMELVKAIIDTIVEGTTLNVSTIVRQWLIWGEEEGFAERYRGMIQGAEDKTIGELALEKLAQRKTQ